MSPPALARLTRALSVVLPTPAETSLLRACLWTGGEARRAWASHRERAGDLRVLLAGDRRGVKKLLPLLLAAVSRNDLDVDEALLTVLRTAHLRAALRAKTVRRIVHEILRSLDADDLPHVVLDGPALAETAYADPAHRHCAAVDLLVRADDLARAARRLSELAGAPDRELAAAPSELRVVTHESGLPIELRSRLVLGRDHALSLDGLFGASRTAIIAGVPTRILSPADGLLDICARAFFEGRRAGLGWVPDAWQVLHRSGDLAWHELLDRSREGDLALPLLVALGFLAEQLGAPIPTAVLGRLREDAARADRVWGEKALAVAVAGPGRLPRLLGLRAGWGPALTVAKWMVFPSRGYVRAHYQPSRAWQVPLCYLYRPLRFAARRLGALGR